MQLVILNLNHFLHAAGGKARFACKSFAVAKIFTDWAPAFMKENCHNFRTSDDIDMKLEPVTKLGKRQYNVKKFWRWRNVGKLWSHCQFFDLWPIGAIRKPDSGCKSLKLTFHFKISNTSLTLLLWVKVVFLPKNADCLQKKCWHQQSFEGLDTKRYTFGDYMCVYFRTKFQVSKFLA